MTKKLAELIQQTRAVIAEATKTGQLDNLGYPTGELWFKWSSLIDDIGTEQHKEILPCSSH